MYQMTVHRFKRGPFRWWIAYRMNDYGCPVDAGASLFRWVAVRRHRRMMDVYSAMREHADWDGA